MNPHARNRPLDILRGLAVLLVLGRHLPGGTTPVSGPLVQAISIWYRIGWSGVDLFFVLSGFLVSGLLFREYKTEGSINAGRFLMRRGLRIWPAFYLMIAVSLLFVWRGTRLSQVLVECFFLQSYIGRGAMWLHTWTLAIEEHFYLALAFLIALLARQRSKDPFRLMPWIWALSAVGCLWSRLMTPYNDPAVLQYTHNRIDALLFGVTLSYLHHFHGQTLQNGVRRLWPLLAVAAAAMLSPIFLDEIGHTPFLTRYGLTLTYLSYGFLLLIALFAVPLKEKAGVIERAVRFVGLRSYSIYLWHMPIGFVVAQPIAYKIGGPAGLWTAVAVYLGVSIAVGHLSYRWVEQPLLAWRDRRWPSASRPVA